QGFVVSYINLDPREIPFHQFKDVYRALMENITLPDNGSFITAWKQYAAQWLALLENREKTCLDLIPEKMPHRFKAILTAMAGKNMAIPNGKKQLKKHARFKPREFPWVLKNALMGKELPAWRLRPALYYRQVSFYRDHSLVCRRSDQYLDAILGMAELFRNMGFTGWVLLFDEGEAIGQARITARSRSYRLLNRMFFPDASGTGFYPVFAFTHDFFHQVADEAYDRVRIRRRRDKTTDTIVEEEQPYFDRDYHAAWKNITVHSLHALSSREWQALIGKLIRLHGDAYNWHPPADELQKAMEGELSKHRGAEARLKLKLLVNHLDLVHQEQFLAEQS
ncbi:MAG TPA: BREX system ATP-binding domain-containing protein, partial [Desulfobacteraceae bacterium]|nr:BREX system ATP-binding domain-containing protein [Desulfobacteraceae bacterium]